MQEASPNADVKDDVIHYTFSKIDKAQQHMHDVDVLKSLRQWGLLQYMTMETYSFPEEYKDIADTSKFISDLFSDDEFIETFIIPGTGGRNYRFPVPNMPMYKKLEITTFSRSFFEPFHRNGQLAINNHLIGCEPTEIDIGKDKAITIHVQTVAHKVLLSENDQSCDGTNDTKGSQETVCCANIDDNDNDKEANKGTDDCECIIDKEEQMLLPNSFKKDLLGKILTILFLGGGLNQYSNDFGEYEKAATLIYRDLITAKRMNDGKVGTECCVYEVTGLGDVQNYDLYPIEPNAKYGNLCVISIHPLKHQVTVFHTGYKRAY